MVRFGVAMGAQAETLSGLSGLGDLVLTCTSTASRNFTLGKALGEGGSAAALLGDRRTVAEGAFTAPVLAGMARERGIAMPIAEAVAALVSDRVPARAIVDTLLARPLRAEVEAGVPYAGEKIALAKALSSDLDLAVAEAAPESRPVKTDEGDVAALAKGGRTNFFGFLARLVARVPFLFSRAAFTGRAPWAVSRRPWSWSNSPGNWRHWGKSAVWHSVWPKSPGPTGTRPRRRVVSKGRRPMSLPMRFW
jgi:hypothetical protein